MRIHIGAVLAGAIAVTVVGALLRPSRPPRPPAVDQAEFNRQFKENLRREAEASNQPRLEVVRPQGDDSAARREQVLKNLQQGAPVFTTCAKAADTLSCISSN